MDRSTIRRVVRDGGGRLLGELQALLRTGGNSDQVAVTILVHPEVRRQGIGTALARDADRIAAEQGRTVLTGTLHAGWPGGPARPVAGPECAAAVGWQQAIAELRSKLSVSRIPSLDGIYQASLERSADYETTPWAGQVPAELMEPVAAINTFFMGNHPLGALRTRPAPITVETLREENRAAANGGVFPYGVVARHRGTGEVVAHSVIRISPDAGPHAKQWLTIVRPDHRGHRLADRVKVENLRQMRAGHPDVEWVWTESAEVNTAMRKINERMGFTIVDRWLKFQRVL